MTTMQMVNSEHYIGHLDACDGRDVTGWVYRPADGLRLEVEILDGDMIVGRGRADLYRDDLKAAGIGDGCHAFRIALADTMLDGREYSLSARIADTESRLAGSPLSVQLRREPAPSTHNSMRGQLDGVAGRSLVGWVMDAERPNHALTVQVVENGKVWATGRADNFRHDLLESGQGDGCHAFNIVLPAVLFDGNHHRLEVRLADGGWILPSSPEPLLLGAEARSPVSSRWGNSELHVLTLADFDMPALREAALPLPQRIARPVRSNQYFLGLERRMLAATTINGLVEIRREGEKAGLLSRIQFAELDESFAECSIRLVANSSETLLELIKVAPAVHRHLGSAKQLAVRYDELRQRLAKQATGVDIGDSDPAAYRAKWLAGPKVAMQRLLYIDCLFDGPDASLTAFFERLCSGILADSPTCLPAGVVGYGLYDGGWFAAVNDRTLDKIALLFRRRMVTGSVDDLTYLFRVLRFIVETTKEHARRIYFRVALPVTQQLYSMRRMREADMASHWAVQMYVLKCRGEQEYSDAVVGFAQHAEDAGVWLGQQLPLNFPALPQDDEPIRIGFVNRGNDIGPGAFDHILAICEWLLKQKPARIIPTLYISDGFHANTKRAFERVGCTVRFMHEQATDPTDMVERHLAMREQFVADGIHMALWVYLPDSLFWFYGTRIAPIQVFMGQLLHPALDVKEIDAYLTYGAPTFKYQAFLGRPWRTIPQTLGTLDSTEHVAEAQAVRSALLREYPGHVILGTLARSEKIAGSGYLETVCRILRENSRAIFLWTGHYEDSNVRDRFVEEGLEARTKFIGWINSKVYARAFDVLLDSFPACNGITALQAMAAGTPIVSMNIATSFFGRDLKQMLDGQVTSSDPEVHRLAAFIREELDGKGGVALPIADSADQYVDFANALIRDPAYRHRLGHRLSMLAAMLYNNIDIMGRSFQSHVLEMVAEASRRPVRKSVTR